MKHRGSRPYSLDLRERVMRVRKKQNLTYVETGKLFGIGEATVNRWARLERETGGYFPREHRGGRRPLLSGEQLLNVQKIVAEKPDRTILELVSVFYDQFQISMSTSTMSRCLAKLGFSFKKKSSVRRSVNAPTLSKNEPSLSSK